MGSNKKLRQEYDLESSEYNSRSKNRKRIHSSSSDNGMNKHSANEERRV
jgi:hypothetical protein